MNAAQANPIAIPAHLKRYLTQLHSYTPAYLTQEIELQWATQLAETARDPSEVQVSHEIVLSARYMCAHLDKLQVPHKSINSTVFEEELFSDKGLCSNIKRSWHNTGKGNLELFSIFRIFQYSYEPFNREGMTYPDEQTYIGTMYTNTLRLQFLEFLAMQPIYLEDIESI